MTRKMLAIILGVIDIICIIISVIYMNVTDFENFGLIAIPIVTGAIGTLTLYFHDALMAMEETYKTYHGAAHDIRVVTAIGAELLLSIIPIIFMLVIL